MKKERLSQKLNIALPAAQVLINRELILSKRVKLFLNLIFRGCIPLFDERYGTSG